MKALHLNEPAICCVALLDWQPYIIWTSTIIRLLDLGLKKGVSLGVPFILRGDIEECNFVPNANGWIFARWTAPLFFGTPSHPCMNVVIRLSSPRSKALAHPGIPIRTIITLLNKKTCIPYKWHQHTVHTTPHSGSSDMRIFHSCLCTGRQYVKLVCHFYQYKMTQKELLLSNLWLAGCRAILCISNPERVIALFDLWTLSVYIHASEIIKLH